MIAAGLLASSCKNQKKENMQEQNPLLAEWNTPYGAPPFDKIKVAHFQPAIEEAIKIKEAEIDSIVNNPAEPDFKNTIAALSYSGSLLDKIVLTFFNLSGTINDDEFQKAETVISTILTKHSDDVSMNAQLFERIKNVYDKKASLNLNPEESHLLETTYKHFVRNGAALSKEDQDKLRKINEELSSMETLFGQNLLSETNAFDLTIDKKEDLAGLPETSVSSAEQTAKEKGQEGKWIFTLQNPSVIPFLQYADNRALREKIWTAWTNRANHDNDKDNKTVLAKIASLRFQKAQLLGYATFADYVLEERMAKNPKNVYDLLNKLWTPALANAKKELSELQKIMDKNRKAEKMEAWDWRYYTEKLRKEKYDLDEEAIKPYLSLTNVQNGIFEVSNKLYGITFTQIKDVPIYYPDVTVWDAKDENGKHLGILYMDFYARASKSGGAWCTSFRDQCKKGDGSNVEPIVSIVFNYPKPVSDQPVLLSIDETQTFFHEFGHALHALFSNVTYRNDVPRDFVELPSQIMENWSMEPEVLKMYAKHYKTGEPMPDALIEKIQKMSKFDQGFGTTEYLAASILDMDYHVLKSAENVKVPEFETRSMTKIGLIKQIPPRYRSTYFAHVFGGGYAAGYYSYIWSAWLDADAFQAFKEKGNIFDKETATKFRNEILSKSGSMDAMQMYLNFRGKQPSVDALLERRGLK